MAQKTQILIVDDDPHIREVIRFALEKAGMDAHEAPDGAQALHHIKKCPPDLVVLDITMPEMDGLETCRTLRKTSDIPILFLSSRDDEIDRIVGLELGADDYVSKPFSPRELVARIHAILKRVQKIPQQPEPEWLQQGVLKLDLQAYSATIAGLPVNLTVREFQLLAALARTPHKVFTREELVERAWPPNIHVSDRTVDSHIRALRAKCGTVEVIRTLHGIGYQLGRCQPQETV